MEKNFKQFIKDSKKVVLTKQEKSQGREQFLNFMESHPAKADSAVHQQLAWSNMFSFNQLTQKPIAVLITLVLVLFATGGVTLASQNSLPGDTLYPVKLKSEEVRSVLAFSTEAKARFEVSLAEKRLEEAEELSNESKLGTDVRIRIEENFQKHANRVEEHVKALVSIDDNAAADISSNLETSLRAHDSILSRLAEAKNGQAQLQIKRLLIKIRSETNDATSNKQREEAQVEAQSNVQDSAEGRLNSVENKMREVKSFLVKVQSRLGADATVDAEARLQVAQNLIIEGKAKLEAKSYNEAFLLFGQAHQVAQEAKLLIEAKRNLNVDIRFKLQNNSESLNKINGGLEIQLHR